VHWCRENEVLSKKFLDLILEVIRDQISSGNGEYRACLRLLYALIILQDGFMILRINYSIPKIMSLIKAVLNRRNPGDERFLFFATKYVLMLAFQNQMVYEWLLKFQDEWSSWVDRNRLYLSS